MTLRSIAAGLVAIGLAALFGRAACAQPMTDKIYARLGAGALVLNDIDFSASAAAYGITLTANGTFSFDPGAAATGAIGYRYNRWIAFEGELGYGSASYDKVSGNFTASVGGNSVTVSGSTTIDGDVTMISGLANLLVTPLGRQVFSPYGGAGIGFVHIKDQIDAIGGDTSVQGSETSTELAADVLAGFDYRVKDAASIGAQYRYFWADSGSDGVDDATAHTFLLTGKLVF